MLGSPFLFVLAALGCFASATFDLASGNWGAAGTSIFIGIALISFMPAGAKRKRRI
jgi:hypothetical protein